MRRLLTVGVVVALLIGGGIAVALVAQHDSAAAQEQGTTQEEGTPEDATADDGTTATDEETDTTSDSRSDAAQDRATRPERGFLLDDVLTDLVADGVITQEQADEIAAAMTARLEELRSELQERRGEFGFLGRHGLDFHGRFGDFLDDGVLDADELAQLPENHPLNDPEGPAAPYLEDGQLTQDELDELKAEVFPQGRGLRGDDSTADPNAEEGLFSG